jgi:hypothetical protein
VRAEVALLVRAALFDTESCCDFVTVGGRLSGSNGSGVAVSVGETLWWPSDGSITRGGFMLCVELAPPLATPSARTGGRRSSGAWSEDFTFVDVKSRVSSLRESSRSSRRYEVLDGDIRRVRTGCDLE